MRQSRCPSCVLGQIGHGHIAASLLTLAARLPGMSMTDSSSEFQRRTALSGGAVGMLRAEDILSASWHF